MPYCHPRIADKGKKAQEAETAQRAGEGGEWAGDLGGDDWQQWVPEPCSTARPISSAKPAGGCRSGSAIGGIGDGRRRFGPDRRIDTAGRGQRCRC